MASVMAGALLGGLLLLPAQSRVWAADVAKEDGRAPTPASSSAPAKKPASSPDLESKRIGSQVREALEAGDLVRKRLSVVVSDKDKKPASGNASAVAPAVAPAHASTPQFQRARAAALGLPVPPAVAPAVATKAAAVATAAAVHEVHWGYEGENGPQAWGQLKPEFSTCASGKRQSPIHIEDTITLQGPAEPIQFSYQPSQGTVVNNGHTIQVDVSGDNSITVRGSEYKLLQFHFHHPSEERINQKAYAMVAHLVHRNLEGQLAVVAVLFDPGAANNLIQKVWTYMPLDTGDKVRMPAGLLDLNELLPKDQRYYQFMGSLTTPPCTEGVLWMVLKQPITLNRDQFRLFAQLFPNNARPVQPLNGRPVREAQ